VIADAGQQEEAVLMADLDFDDIDKARAAIPSLSNHQLG
jgi:predicted amidohydrolase